MLEVELLRPEVIVKVYDRDGRLIREVRREAKCFVRNFVETLYGMLTEETVSIVTPDGSAHSVKLTYSGQMYCDGSTSTYHYIESRHLLAKAGAGDASYGILVGTGTTPPSNDDYALESKIPHGSGDGQLDHRAVSVSDVTEDPVHNIAFFDISRSFSNLGSVDINVSELGLFVWTKIELRDEVCGTAIYTDLKYLIIRDVLDVPVTVSPGGSLVVTYRIKAGIPFLSNFIKWLRALMACEDTEATGLGGSAITITGCIPRKSYGYYYHRRTGPAMPMYAKAGDGSDSYGVLIGSGTTGEAITDYSMESKLSNSVMHYHAVEPGGIEDRADRWRIRIKRSFTNVSGVEQTVAEVGLVTWQRYYMRSHVTTQIDISNLALVFRKRIIALTVKPDQVLNVTINISVPK